MTWLKDGALHNSNDYVNNRKGVVVNRMEYRGLQRSDLGLKFACQAINTNLTSPVTREVTVVLNRK